ncbi:SGNH/GDSL hydrolase family protein [Paraglaciecola sp.]|nr:SGNH/GDSL hydrolase family protein [Paraglaciecola sp.]
MDVLILGFSVTADNKGYVEEFCSAKDNNIVVSKVGLGGIQPHHLAFFMEDILKSSQADIVVLEISTAGFRSFLSQELYVLSIFNILKVVLEKGAKPLIFDVPRSDVDPENDWVADINESICKQFDIQYVAAHVYFDEPIDNYFRDGIHTNAKGATKLANILRSEICLVECEKFSPSVDSLPSQLRELRLYINDAPVNVDNYVEFTRSGYVGKFQQLGPNSTLELAMNNNDFCHGVFYLMGPETGVFKLQFGREEKTITALDAHCYYRRLGVYYFPAIQLEAKLLVKSNSERPGVKLLKGELSKGEVNNFIGGLLCSNIQDIDLLAKKLKSLLP